MLHTVTKHFTGSVFVGMVITILATHHAFRGRCALPHACSTHPCACYSWWACMSGPAPHTHTCPQAMAMQNEHLSKGGSGVKAATGSSCIAEHLEWCLHVSIILPHWCNMHRRGLLPFTPEGWQQRQIWGMLGQPPAPTRCCCYCRCCFHGLKHRSRWSCLQQ